MAALHPSSVDVSSKRGRLFTPAGQSTVGFQLETLVNLTFECLDNRSPSLSLQGLCNRSHMCHVHGLLPRQCS